MRGKLVNEDIRFERGQDPRKGMDIGVESLLRKRSMANLVGKGNSKRIAAEIGGEFMYDIDLNKIFLLTKSGDGYLSKRNPLFDPKMWKVLEPHLSEYNIKSTRTTGAGVETTIYDTPYGKVVREHNNIGVDQYWAERDTYLGFLNSMNESIDFERGKSPKDQMGLGIKEAIHQWFDEIFPSFKPTYHINEDNTIIVRDFEVPDSYIGEFPEYINFSECLNDFHVDFCGLTSLRGCPTRVNGFFSCEGNKLTSLKGMPGIVHGDIFVRDNPGRFTKRDVLSNIKIQAGDSRIYAEDSRVNETMRAKYVFEAVGFKRMGPDAGKHAIAGSMGIGHEGAKFDFGKYKGDSAYEVFEKDPQYILWLAGGGMSPRNDKQRKVFEIIKQLEKQYYDDIKKQGFEYYGSPGDVYEGIVNVEYVRYVSGDYGAAYTMSANDGKHKFRFYFNYNKAAKLAPDHKDREYNPGRDPVTDFMESLIGKDIEIKGKVKYHKEYKGYPWTNLNYTKILSIPDEG